MPFKVINLTAHKFIKATQNDHQTKDLPADHPASPFPIFTPLESCISCDELLKDGMQLIFCTETKLEGIHERDKVL